MSRNSPPNQAADAFERPPGRDGNPHRYTLTSELARLCLPATYRDENKKLAWASSICFLFLLVGLIGLKSRQTAHRQLPEPVEIVPVVFTPPEPLPATQPELPNDLPEPAPETAIVDAPAIAPVVAADASQVAFAVPVEGPVVIAPARFAPPPPVELKPQPVQPQPAQLQTAPPQPAPPKPTKFVSSGSDPVTMPLPTYPKQARQLSQQGRVLLCVVVDRSGLPVSVEVKVSSGHVLLDRHTADWIKNRWRWLPGPTQYCEVPIIFHIK